MIILRQVILYIERVQYVRHAPCRNLIEANKAEVLSALRIEVMQRECARIAADGVRHG